MIAARKEKCQKCKQEIVFNKDPFVPAVCSCGHMQIHPFKESGIEFQKLLLSSPIFLLFHGFYEEKKLFVNITLLRKNVPDYDWCLYIANEQAELLMKLRHLNICPIFDFKEINGYFCLTTPTLDGYPLSAYLPEKHGLLEVNKIIDILQTTALGMAVAHYNKIIHHNICPENIHIDQRGIIRVKEFFVSRFIYIYDQKRIKRDNHIYTSVSPFYISPEKVESGAEDTRGDIFSFGVMSYYFLTGKFPFYGKRKVDTIYTRAKLKHKAKRGKISMTYHIGPDDFPDYIPPPIPKHLRDDIPSDISELIIQMLSYYPHDRPTFSEVISEFNMLRAKTDAVKIRKVQEEIIDSDTRAIPKMKSPFIGRVKNKKTDYEN